MKRPWLVMAPIALAVAATPALGHGRTSTPSLSSSRLVAIAAKNDPPASKNAGTIDGHVAAVSYSASTVTVATGGRRVLVHVLPSTNIQGPSNAFHTIADIKKGAHVRILLSQTGSTYNAQLITLL